MENIDTLFLVGIVLFSVALGAFLMWIHRSITDDIKQKINEELRADKEFYALLLRDKIGLGQKETDKNKD